MFAVDEIVDEYNRQINEYRLFSYMQQLISRMKAEWIGLHNNSVVDRPIVNRPKYTHIKRYGI